MDDDALSGLTPEQRAAVTHGGGPLLVLAGAGSGKTGVLAHRLAWLVRRGVSPSDIVALTYTRAAADELRARAEGLIADVHETLRVGTFHAFAGELLRTLGEDDDMEQIAPEERRLLMFERLGQLHLVSHDLRGPRARALVGDFIALIDRCRDELVDPNEYLDWAQRELDGATSRKERLEGLRQHEFARTLVAHDEWLAERGQADFGLAIHRALDRLADPAALDRASGRVRHIVVDEFQDVNFALSRLLNMLGDRAESFVAVGDDDQAIYRFRGASSQNLRHFRERFPGVEEIRLEHNFRSHQPILDAAHAVVAPLPDRSEKRLVAARGADGPALRFWGAIDPIAQAESVVAEIARLARDEGVPLEEQAIVMRGVRTESPPFLAALDAAGIAYQVRGGTGLFERREVRAAMAWLRLLAYPTDAQAHLRVAADPAVGAPSAEAVDLVANGTGSHTGGLVRLAREAGRPDGADLIEELVAAAAAEPPRAAVRAVLDRAGLRRRAVALGGAEGAARLEGLSQLERLVIERLDRDPALDFRGLVALLVGLDEQDYRGGGPPPERRGVQVTTIHSAKGLEFDVVFFVGMTQRNLPGAERARLEIPAALLRESLPSGAEAHEAEMRRLAYVALTRARHRLYLVRPEENDRGWRQYPSPYFNEAMAAVGGAIEVVGVERRPDLDIIEAARQRFEAACQAAVVAEPGRATDVRAAALAAAAGLVDARMGAAAAEPAARLSDPPIRPPEPASLTPSALTDYLRCPLQYRFSRVDRIPARDDVQRRIGTAVHGALDEHYRPGGEGGDGAVLLARVERWLAAAGVDRTLEGGHVRDRARHVLGRYHDQHGGAVPVLDTELTLTMPLGPHRLRMRIDRTEPQGETTVRVVDYKTGPRPPGRPRPDESLALTLYVAALATQRGGRVQAAFHHILDREPIVPLPIDDDDVADALVRAEAAADGIVRRDFTPTPGWHCTMCDFRLICPTQDR